MARLLDLLENICINFIFVYSRLYLKGIGGMYECLLKK